MLGKGFNLVLWFFGGCLLVLIVKNPVGFTMATNSVFSGVNGLGRTLTGNGVSGAYPAGTVVTK